MVDKMKKNNYIKKILITAVFLTVIANFSVRDVNAYDQIRPFEPQIINEGDIPNRGIFYTPVPKEYRCYLQAGHKYHIFLVGDWISNSTEATDYDIEVRNPSNVVVSINTESAGLPEQVANDEKHQFFIPSQSGDYRFLIYNDPKDSYGEEAAVFMIIEHLEMNTRYSTILKGKPSVGAQYPQGYDVGYEFNTSEPKFLLYIEVPDPIPDEGIKGLDMYEARVYPMANPLIDEGYSIQGVGVPFGDFLNGQEPLLGYYGGFNTEIDGFRFPDLRISCEAAGVDMRKEMIQPGVNVSEITTENNNVYYYMALLAEYFEGEVEFYMKTDYSPVNLTIIDPPETGYTGETTLIKVETESVSPIDSMWLEYSTDSWKTKKRVELTEKTDYWLAILPSFNLHDNVQYKIFAEDEIDNKGTFAGSFSVMNKVEIDYGISSNIVLGGQSVLITGKATRPSINLELNIELDGNIQKINLQTDGEGSFTYDYKPTKIGEHDITISYLGDEDYHPTVSEEKSFRVDKRKLELSCELDNSDYKVKRAMTISGQLTPGVNGIEIEIIFVTPISSFVNKTNTARDGSFSLTITPKEVGSWEMLPQIKTTELFDASQGELLSFEVKDLTLYDVAMYKANELTKPPVIYILIVIFIAILGSLLMRTEYVKERLNKKQEEKESPEEIDGELTGYKRRSSR